MTSCSVITSTIDGVQGRNFVIEAARLSGSFVYAAQVGVPVTKKHGTDEVETLSGFTPQVASPTMKPGDDLMSETTFFKTRGLHGIKFVKLGAVVLK